MLYHVSLKSWEIIDEFIPRIPKSRCELTGEDDNIPRISLSSSIEGCLTGVPWGGFELLNNPPLKNSKMITVMRVYEFEEINIDRKNIIKPDVVKNYVADAKISGEYWVVNQSINPSRSYLLILKDFCFDFEIINHNSQKIRVCKIKDIKYEKLSKEEEALLISEFNRRSK